MPFFVATGWAAVQNPGVNGTRVLSLYGEVAGLHALAVAGDNHGRRRKGKCVALGTYWCVLLHRETKFFSGKPVFDEATRFTCELDPDLSYTIRAAFLHGIRQHGGEEASPSEYRMDVYAAAGYSQPVLEGFTVPPDGGKGQPPESLAGYSDDQLLSELAWRLKRR